MSYGSSVIETRWEEFHMLWLHHCVSNGIFLRGGRLKYVVALNYNKLFHYFTCNSDGIQQSFEWFHMSCVSFLFIFYNLGSVLCLLGVDKKISKGMYLEHASPHSIGEAVSWQTRGRENL